VRDPDTGATIDSVTVSLAYDESPLSLVKWPVNRIAYPDAAGRYIICGLPPRMKGRVQLIRNGVEYGEIPVAADDGSPLVLRALGMSLSTQRVIAGDDSAGRPLRILHGNATLKGRVISKAGQPVAAARVQMDGTLAVATTRTDGTFALDSVPTGTQSISVRKIGYSVTDKAVDVAANGASPVTVTMADYVPTLAPVVSVAQRTKDLEAAGFSRRKARGVGFFLEGDQIDTGAPTLGEALRMIPGLRIGYDAQNQVAQKTMIMTSRDPRGCVKFIVDDVFWREIGGDIEKFVRPDEIEALEMYGAKTVPGEYAYAGRGVCSVLVLWTKHKIHRALKPG
jgi:hypothetical protein